MKTTEILTKKLSKIEAQISEVSFERRDTSVKSGRHYTTIKADAEGLIIFETYRRTPHLNTYICVDEQYKELIEQYYKIKEELEKAHKKQFVRESIKKSIEAVERDIAAGNHLTNYGKMFIQGITNIYYAHPFYKHSDYNKWRAMPNTPKHWKIAQELNKKLIDAGMKIDIV
jgi:hypothetical protein